MPSFESTFWTVIEGAKRSSPEALEKLVSRYRPAVVSYARQFLDEAAAEDVAQEVFLALVHEEILAKADRALGRFRNLLIGVTRNKIARIRERASAQKRGGGKAPLSLDAGDGMKLGDLIASEENDAGFDRTWLNNILQLAMSRLAAECEDRDTKYHSVLQSFVGGGVTYRDLAARYGLSEKEVKNNIYIARRKLTELLHEEIAAYCSSQKEYEAEIQYLSVFLRKKS